MVYLQILCHLTLIFAAINSARKRSLQETRFLAEKTIPKAID
ncbi:hypothetical protein PN467_11890 [Microcystis aeruginosa CS-563/04]|nr:MULTISPECIES: hypothetical protein [Microcystis]MDB9397000.1 hypothetical protein [Microcystis aeruginosa CS-573]MDB9421195.1 hypothetical protein [Microcystis aeruginosa CS-563/04]MDB9507013.1 hypothetical protein [Microcystis aeruginosa CS-338/01]